MVTTRKKTFRKRYTKKYKGGTHFSVLDFSHLNTFTSTSAKRVFEIDRNICYYFEFIKHSKTIKDNKEYQDDATTLDYLIYYYSQFSEIIQKIIDDKIKDILMKNPLISDNLISDKSFFEESRAVYEQEKQSVINELREDRDFGLNNTKTPKNKIDLTVAQNIISKKKDNGLEAYDAVLKGGATAEIAVAAISIAAASVAALWEYSKKDIVDEESEEEEREEREEKAKELIKGIETVIEFKDTSINYENLKQDQVIDEAITGDINTETINIVFEKITDVVLFATVKSKSENDIMREKQQTFIENIGQYILGVERDESKVIQEVLKKDSEANGIEMVQGNVAYVKQDDDDDDTWREVPGTDDDDDADDDIWRIVPDNIPVAVEVPAYENITVTEVYAALSVNPSEVEQKSLTRSIDQASHVFKDIDKLFRDNTEYMEKSIKYLFDLIQKLHVKGNFLTGKDYTVLITMIDSKIFKLIITFITKYKDQYKEWIKSTIIYVNKSNGPVFDKILNTKKYIDQGVLLFEKLLENREFVKKVADSVEGTFDVLSAYTLVTTTIAPLSAFSVASKVGMGMFESSISSGTATDVFKPVTERAITAAALQSSGMLNYGNNMLSAVTGLLSGNAQTAQMILDEYDSYKSTFETALNIFKTAQVAENYALSNFAFDATSSEMEVMESLKNDIGTWSDATTMNTLTAQYFSVYYDYKECILLVNDTICKMRCIDTLLPKDFLEEKGAPNIIDNLKDNDIYTMLLWGKKKLKGVDNTIKKIHSFWDEIHKIQKQELNIYSIFNEQVKKHINGIYGILIKQLADKNKNPGLRVSFAAEASDYKWDDKYFGWVKKTFVSMFTAKSDTIDDMINTHFDIIIKSESVQMQKLVEALGHHHLNIGNTHKIHTIKQQIGEAQKVMEQSDTRESRARLDELLNELAKETKIIHDRTASMEAIIDQTFNTELLKDLILPIDDKTITYIVTLVYKKFRSRYEGSMYKIYNKEGDGEYFLPELDYTDAENWLKNLRSNRNRADADSNKEEYNYSSTNFLSVFNYLIYNILIDDTIAEGESYSSILKEYITENIQKIIAFRKARGDKESFINLMDRNVDQLLHKLAFELFNNHYNDKSYIEFKINHGSTINEVVTYLQEIDYSKLGMNSLKGIICGVAWMEHNIFRPTKSGAAFLYEKSGLMVLFNTALNAIAKPVSFVEERWNDLRVWWSNFGKKGGSTRKRRKYKSKKNK